jgi:hypothetical protein
MKRLYRGGVTSPLLHDIDATNWIAAGWAETHNTDTLWSDRPNALQETEEAPQGQVTPTRGENPLLPIEARLAELQALAQDGNWRTLKAIAEAHGITRPSDGWDAAVLPILVAEYGQSAAEEVFTSPEATP